MKILIISKYPPIEGGVSAKTYWTAKALGERNHEVFIVSNCWEVEEQYREEINKEGMEYLEPKNVKLFSTSSFRSPIARSRYYTPRLVSLALDAIRKYNIDVIYSHYILPYGITALIIKKITNKPWLLRHAGSDITRLFSNNQLKTLFKEVFIAADKVVAYRNTADILAQNNLHLEEKFVNLGQAINLEEFNPSVKPFDLSIFNNYKENIPVFSYFGKIGRMKKTYEFVDATSLIKDKDFLLLFVTERGINLEELKKYCKEKNIEEKCIFMPFQPPWKIPSIMRTSTCIVSPESEETPFLPAGTHNPQIVREAMACGKCAIIGEGVSKKGLYIRAENKKHFLVVNSNNKEQFASVLKFVIENPEEINKIGENARSFAEQHENFDRTIEQLENIFKSMIQ